MLTRFAVASTLALVGALTGCGGGSASAPGASPSRSTGSSTTSAPGAASSASPAVSAVPPAPDVKPVAAWTSRDPDGTSVDLILKMARPILLSDSAAAGALACRDNVNHPNESVAIHVQLAASTQSPDGATLRLRPPGTMVADRRGVCDRSGLDSSVDLAAGGTAIVDYWIVEPDIVTSAHRTAPAATGALASDIRMFHRPEATFVRSGYSDRAEGPAEHMVGTHVIRCRDEEWVFYFVPRSYQDTAGPCRVGVAAR